MFPERMRKIFVVYLLLFSVIHMKASHIVGGEIYYKCLGNNMYEFTVNIYRDCLPESQGGGNSAALLADNPAYLSIFQGSTLVFFDSIPANSIQTVPTNFSNDCLNNPPNTCLSMMQFKFQRLLPPSAVPYSLYYQRCCRNGTINNINNPGITGATYFCEIPATPISCNSSAVFKNYPPQIICINNPFVYDHSALDTDGDSLSYDFCPALIGGDKDTPKPIITTLPGLFGVSYRSPFSASNPIIGNPPITIDPKTGIITGTPNMQGRFVVTICCHEWRNGVMINTIRRDFQFVVTNCSRAVVADVPVLSQEANTYVIQCKSFTVPFRNTSTGGFKYHWDFGVTGLLDDTSDQFQPTYTYPDSGTYKVTLWVNQGTTCPDSITRLVKVYPTFKANFSYSGLLCPESPISFTDESTTPYSIIDYWFWNFKDGTTTSDQNPVHAFPNAAAEYNVTLIAGNALGCRDTAVKVVKIPLVNIFAGNDTVIVKNEVINYNATGGVSYTWSPGDYLNFTNINNPTGVYSDTGVFTYILQGITKDGCTGYDTIQVTVAKDPYLLMPTVFSPNGDGLNDYFNILYAGFRRLNSFKIFDRWGKLVFETNDFRKGWDGRLNGRLCDVGAYFWVISAIDLANRPKLLKGDISIVY